MSKKENGNSAVQLPVKIEVKNIAHYFTKDELAKLGDELAEKWGEHGRVEREEDSVKKQYKARLSDIESRIGVVSCQIRDKFEMREERCKVRYFPADRKKRYWPENTDPDTEPHVLEEVMVDDDFQQELILAESKFDRQEKIELFPPTDTDRGVIVVGLLGKVWFAAVRARIGNNKLEERLDSEQPISAKARFDAITKASKRFEKWVIEVMGKDIWKGFIDPVAKAIEPHKERVE